MRRALGFLGDWAVALLSLAYVLALGPLVPGLLSAPNLGNVVSNFLPLLVVSLGQTLVLVAGGIDLSVTAVVALASVAGAKVMTEEMWIGPKQQHCDLTFRTLRLAAGRSAVRQVTPDGVSRA